MDFAKFASIYVTCDPENWEGALTVAEQEIRRAVTHGFNNAEFSEVKANLLNAYERQTGVQLLANQEHWLIP